MENLEVTAKSLKKCRDIKNEILRFGVNQLEIQQVIKLLALELEDRNMMLAVVNSLDEKKHGGNILLPEE